MQILGYADKISVQVNEELQIKVSCLNIKSYNANLIKIIQGILSNSTKTLFWTKSSFNTLPSDEYIRVTKSGS